ncbi:MAG: glucose-6-phosphate isomerase [Eubacteriales bacterium]|nr:glucose-6-phosphate isomerase [Eubacteriales bacterium]
MNINTNKFNWKQGFTVGFCLQTGMSDKVISTKRNLSDMRGMYFDEAAAEKLTAECNPLIYEFFETGAPEKDSDLAFGTSITYPGKVGNEFFMTKGHFHTILETAEVYYCLGGCGYMLIENPEGDWSAQKLAAGTVVYVPPRYAHRSVNTGDTPLVTLFCFRADAGHDYGTIETKGYRKLIVEQDARVKIIDNPKWKKK